MSPDGQAVEVRAVQVGSFELDDRRGFPIHEHPTHQLAWASSGTLVMAVEGRTWVLPRSRALWIPAGMAHDVLAAGATRMVSLYFRPEDCPVDFDEATVIDTRGLLGHLIDHLTQQLDPDAWARAAAVVFDLLSPLPIAELRLPEPTDPRVREIGAALQSDPSDDRTLADWGRRVGASGRTLARLIHRDTGMTFATWRTHFRVAAALRLLANGMPVARVASTVGYATPSAFVAAFRRTVGTTPGQYFSPEPDADDGRDAPP
jgi:AraC-like DNA-binding protein/quercetin dioxygenase-like cupin family protein